MSFVLDASVTASWALADEASVIAEKARLRLETESAIVPHIWWYEIRNLLVVNERRNRLTAANTVFFLENLSNYPIEMAVAADQEAIFQLARLHHLSFYDAAYLALALRERIPLATLDKALRSAAAAIGIPLLS